MPLVKNVEKQIEKVEGVKVVIIKDGKDVRSDANLPTQYAAKKMTKNSSSVNALKEKFKRQYPGYDLLVKKKNGTTAAGQTKLATVRDTYLPDDD